ncbi:MAG: TonB-dependent receptor [Bacteroidetes bacterium]|nr:MAG: TonB-dependent receptor [Bacteroidota bacterium]
MKYWFAGFLTVLVLTTQAQFPGGGRPSGANAQNMNVGHFYGKIVDAKTNKAIDGVTVQLLANRFDTVAKKMKEIIAATQVTQSNGDFSFEQLAVFGKYKLRITAVGYKETVQPLSFDIKMGGGAPSGGMSQMLSMVDKDLGNIKVEAEEGNLGNVTVTSTAKQLFEMGVDRKIFNVDKNIVATGQTATEVMRQIPGINVDIDGNVSLRNATPTLFVDGRPTTLTLDQIPADIIEKVELITNPSAKFDASGGNAGIMNIVLKKNKKVGYNGGLRAGSDSRGRINLGGDLNLRQNKFNFFSSFLFNQRKSINTFTNNRNLFTTPSSNVGANGKGITDGYFGFIRGGFDYFVDNRNTITVNANYNRGQFNGDSRQVIDSFIGNNLLSYSNNNSISTNNFENLGTQLSYKHNFAKNGHNISADFNYNSAKSNGVSDLNIATFQPNNNPKGLPFIQRNNTVGSNKFYTFQADYENPLTETTKFEAGARAAIRDFRNNLDQSLFNHALGEYVIIPRASNKYKYIDAVYAAYGTYSFKRKNWSYQLGLRAESSDYTGTLIGGASGGGDTSFSIRYPLSLFPSAFITYRLSDKQDIQINYSRRVNRPNFFQLIPFPDLSDPQNISIGNVALRPEFTNSFEVNYNNTYKKGANLLISGYFKYSTDLITRFQFKGVSPINTDSVVYFTFQNASYSLNYGLELTNRFPVTKNWDMTGNLNIYNSVINGSNIQAGLTNQQVSWFFKWNNNIKLKKNYSIQLSGDYQARTVLPPGGGGGGGRFGGGGGGMFGGGGVQATAQGFIKPRYSFDLALRKDWTWKGGNSASLTLSMNDIFRTQLFETFSEAVFFNQINSRRRDPQLARINFSYRFGKFDANLFKRKNTKAEGGGFDAGGMMGQ